VSQLNYSIPEKLAFITAKVTKTSINWKDSSRSIKQQAERNMVFAFHFFPTPLCH